MLVVVSHMFNRLPWFVRPVRQESGQSLIEYGMLAALVALIAIGAVSAVGGEINANLWEPMAASF